MNIYSAAWTYKRTDGNPVEGEAERYNAIVVDEAQDFSDEYWFSID